MRVDFEFLSALVTVVWFVAFVGLWVWAWSGRRQSDYAAAARMPLDETADHPVMEQEGER